MARFVRWNGIYIALSIHKDHADENSFDINYQLQNFVDVLFLPAVDFRNLRKFLKVILGRLECHIEDQEGHHVVRRTPSATCSHQTPSSFPRQYTPTITRQFPTMSHRSPLKGIAQFMDLPENLHSSISTIIHHP